MFCRICLWSHVVLDFCFRESLNYIFCFTSSDSLFKYLFFTQIWWAVCSRNLSIYYRLSNMLAHNCSQYSLIFFSIFAMFILFHFLFYLGSLSFLLGEPGQRFLNFLLFFFKKISTYFLYALYYFISADFSFRLSFFF